MSELLEGASEPLPPDPETTGEAGLGPLTLGQVTPAITEQEKRDEQVARCPEPNRTQSQFSSSTRVTLAIASRVDACAQSRWSKLLAGHGPGTSTRRCGASSRSSG